MGLLGYELLACHWAETLVEELSCIACYPCWCDRQQEHLCWQQPFGELLGYEFLAGHWAETLVDYWKALIIFLFLKQHRQAFEKNNSDLFFMVTSPLSSNNLAPSDLEQNRLPIDDKIKQ